MRQGFYERWEIEYNESTEERFKKFKTRVFNLLSLIDYYIADSEIGEFCHRYGIEEIWQYNVDDTKYSYNIINSLKTENTELGFYYLLEIIFSLNIYNVCTKSGVSYSKNQLLNKIKEAVEWAKLDVRILQEEEILFLPKGEKFLDDELVNKTLIFLDKSSRVHFIDSLKTYKNTKVENKNIKAAEGLRRACEEFLKYTLNNKKILKQNILLLQKEMTEKKIASFFKKNIFTIFNSLDMYFNEQSKHHDGDITDSDCELLIYQVGLLLRFIAENIK